MSSRSLEDLLFDDSDVDGQPETKRPRIASTEENADKEGWSLLNLLTNNSKIVSKAIPVMVENEWVDVKDLGRLEQTCKAMQISEDAWSAFCFLRWPSTRLINRKFFARIGGYRGYCRKKMTKPAIGPKNEGRLEIPPCNTHKKDFYFLLDLYVKNKPVLCRSVSMKHKNRARSFQEDGKVLVWLKDPVVLGRMKCYKEKGCRCAEKCIFYGLFPSNVVRCSLSLFRGADHVSIFKAKSSTFRANHLHNSKITLDVEEGKYKKEEASKQKSLTSLMSAHVNENNMLEKYEDQGISLRRTPISSEIKRRVNYNPIGISVLALIDILPCGQKYGIVSIGFGIMQHELNQRGNGNIQGYVSSGLFSKNSKTKFDLKGVTPFHILEELQSSDSLP